MRRALIFFLALAACRDFDGLVDRCIDAGVCVEGDGGSGGGVASTGGGEGGGTAATGGGTTSGTGGGTTGTGGGTTGTGGGTTGTGGGTTGAGGGTTGAGGGTTGAGGGATGGGPSGFTANVNTAVLSMAPGTWAFASVQIIRDDPFNDDTLHFDLVQADGGASPFTPGFEPQDTMFDDTELWVISPLQHPLGSYPHELRVTLFGLGTLLATVPLTVEVRARRPVLVVDDDTIGANQGGGWPSDEDTPWDVALTSRGVTYDRLVVPYDAARSTVPFEVLRDYGSVVWYNGGSWPPAITFPAQNEMVVTQWLAQGSRKLLLSSPGLMSRYGSSWNTANDFVRDQLGGIGTRYVSDTAPNVFSNGTVIVPYGTSINIVGYLNPGTATVLFTETTPDSGYPVATRNATDAGSTVVYAGFNMDHVLSASARQPALNALLDAAGIP